ncbi:MAG: HAMP domain-containing histidine kinase [Bacteroidetes bacterium]|nr:HAMP domain-containing histidine kinase [Bacteroidota bacterium]
MNRRLFIFVVILMGISMAGIILLQLFWIRNAISIREEHFNKTVNLALRETSEKLESHENILLLDEKIYDYGRPSVRAGFIPDSNTSQKILIYGDSSHSTSYSYSLSTEGNSDVFVEVWSETDDDIGVIEYKHEISADSIRHHVSRLKTDVKIDTLSKVFTHDIIYIGEGNDTIVEGSDKGYIIIKKAQNLNEAFIKMAYEIVSTPIPIEKRIDTAVLHEVLTGELFNKGIHAPYEFAVMQIDSLRSFPICSKGFDTEDIDKKYVVSIFPNELLEESNLLIVQFPGRNIHLLKSIAWTLSVSLLLTLIILATFAITIFMILRQKKLSDIKSDFINNMTHEFKTPIATVSLAVDSINNPKIIKEEKEVRYYTGIIREEIQRMNKQVESVLRMSLLDKHELEFNLIETDIHELIDRTVSKVSLLLNERNGKIEVDAKAEDALVKIDPDHFTNALLNLLDNAIKYSEAEPQIVISTRNMDDGLTISVKDHGMGMSKEVQQKIFDKFYRKSSGNIHNIKGFGLGLSYVKAIVEAFGGSISVKSETGKGSTFNIFLPKK